MYEIDALLVGSIQLTREAKLSATETRVLIWNLESIPERYALDAGGFERMETDDASSYRDMHVYLTALELVRLAERAKDHAIVYHWCAFVLNNWDQVFRASTPPIASLMEGELAELRQVYRSIDPATVEPMHATLTMYPDGMKWFSEEQNELIRWFCQA